MARGRKRRGVAVGVAEHGNSAVLVTIAPDGELLDRRTFVFGSALPRSGVRPRRPASATSSWKHAAPTLDAAAHAPSRAGPRSS